MLAAVLFVVLQPDGGLHIFSGIQAARHRSLHGASDDSALLDLEKQLGRERENLVPGHVQKCTVGDGLPTQQGCKCGIGADFDGHGDLVGEVDLIGLAGEDVFLDALDLRRCSPLPRSPARRCRQRRRAFSVKRPGIRLAARSPSKAACLVIEDKRLSIDSEPRERKTLRGERNIFESFEVISAFVAEKARCIEAAGERLLNLPKESLEISSSVYAAVVLYGIEEEEASLVGRIEASSLKQHGVRMAGDQGVQLLRKLVPSIQAVSMGATQRG